MVRIKYLLQVLSSNPALDVIFSRTPRYQHEISSDFSLTSAIRADKVQDTLSNGRQRLGSYEPVGNRLDKKCPIGVWVIVTIQPPLPAFEFNVIQ